jgi:prepilin-type processing-associated H-X9-DG protein
VRIWNGESALYDVDLFTARPFWQEGSHADFGYRPSVWKVNDEYYQSLGIGHGSAFASAPNFSYDPTSNQLPQYETGADPDVYWFLMEDQRTGSESRDASGDGSLNDLHVRVNERPDGQWECHFYRDPASIYHYDLLPPDDGEIIEWIGARGNNGPYYFKAGEFVSYGMSTHVGRMSPGVRKILAIDYEAQVCWVGTGAASQSDGYGDLVAPRHLGKLNVLFSDGGVVTMAPEEIDPEMTELHERYWDPAQ